jgi:hypothetical protein
VNSTGFYFTGGGDNTGFSEMSSHQPSNTETKRTRVVMAALEISLNPMILPSPAPIFVRASLVIICRLALVEP